MSSCTSDPEVRIATKTETVPELVEVFKELPANLTDPVPYPTPLSAEFTVDDLLDLTFALFDALDQANRDKADAGELTQPTASEPVPE